MRTEGGHTRERDQLATAKSVHPRSSDRGRRGSALQARRRRATRRRIRKVLFFVLLLGASAGMGYLASLYQPSPERTE